MKDFLIIAVLLAALVAGMAFSFADSDDPACDALPVPVQCR